MGSCWFWQESGLALPKPGYPQAAGLSTVTSRFCCTTSGEDMWAQHSQGATDPELSAQAEAEGKSCCWSLFEVWRRFQLRNRVALPRCGGKGAEASY